jgi:hypothetical protein
VTRSTPEDQPIAKVQEDQPVSLTISPSQARSVGRDLSAWRIHAGTVFLVESHMVGDILLGEGREVVAVVIFAGWADGGRLRVITWAGATPGHDAEHETTGVAVYEADSAVTVLGHIGTEAAA